MFDIKLDKKNIPVLTLNFCADKFNFFLPKSLGQGGKGSLPAGQFHYNLFDRRGFDKAEFMVKQELGSRT